MGNEMLDALDRPLEIGDKVAYVCYDSKPSRSVTIWMEQGVVVGFTPCYVLIKSIAREQTVRRSRKYVIKL